MVFQVAFASIACKVCAVFGAKAAAKLCGAAVWCSTLRHCQQHRGFITFGFELSVDCCMFRNLVLLPTFFVIPILLSDPIWSCSLQFKKLAYRELTF